MKEVRISDANELARVVSGTVDPVKLTVFSVMKNEMAMLPAFLRHNRRLGFEQFLILDDGSDDGTLELLKNQPDCVVMQSDLSFGDTVRYRDPNGKVRNERAGTYFKIALPHVFFEDLFVAYLDADEFLLPPPGVDSIRDVIVRLQMEGASSAIASVVEFFPEDVAALDGPMPENLPGLIKAYPYFQPETLVKLKSGEQPKLVGESKTGRLFKKYKIKPKVERKGLQKIWMPSRQKKAQMFQKSPRHKTPIVLRSDTSWLTGSHEASLPPSDSVLLCIAHFVFTAQFKDKIDRAISWEAHANNASKYKYYRQLLDKMSGVEKGFLDDKSVKFTNRDQLVEAGLTIWEKDP